MIKENFKLLRMQQTVTIHETNAESAKKSQMHFSLTVDRLNMLLETLVKPNAVAEDSRLVFDCKEALEVTQNLVTALKAYEELHTRLAVEERKRMEDFRETIDLPPSLQDEHQCTNCGACERMLGVSLKDLLDSNSQN